MKVLVTAAGKHGTTVEIAQAIAHDLDRLGVAAEFVEPSEVAEIESYDAVVLGSAVYNGHWRQPALAFVDRHGAALSTRPVWLFSCGPIGEPPKPVDACVDIAESLARTGAREHKVFAGRLERAQLGFAERAMVQESAR